MINNEKGGHSYRASSLEPHPAIPEWQDDATVPEQKIPVIFPLVVDSGWLLNPLIPSIGAQCRSITGKAPDRLFTRKQSAPRPWKTPLLWIAPLTLSVGARLP